MILCVFLAIFFILPFSGELQKKGSMCNIVTPQNTGVFLFGFAFRVCFPFSLIQAMSTLPLLISAVVALGRYNYQDSTAEIRALDPRSIVQAILVPKNFSTFGLRHRQKPARRTILPMLSVRVVCGLVLLTMMQGIDCMVSTYACLCESSWIPDPPNVACATHLAARMHRLEVGDGATVTLNDLDAARGILDHRSICSEYNLDENDLVKTNNIPGSSGRWIVPRNCGMYLDVPAMLREPCQLGALDIYRFRDCTENLPAFFAGVCHGRFTICAAFRDHMTYEKLRVVIYIFLPMYSLWCLLVAHFLAQVGKCSLMDVEEDRTLRKQVNQKTRVYLEQLQNGSLESSLLRLGIRCNPLCRK